MKNSKRNFFKLLGLSLISVALLPYRFIYSATKKIKKISISNITTKTLAFTYLNPHVYSDTVFFLGNFSKNLLDIDKYYFGIGASIASFLFFFLIGYLSKLLSKYLQSTLIWRRINLFIIIFMSIITFYVLIEIVKFF